MHSESSSPKVAHVVLNLNCGGLERIVLDLIRARRASGQSVDVICLEEPGVLASEARDLGAAVLCVAKRAGVRFETFGRLRSVLRELRPDVVHTHQITAAFYTGSAARRAGVPVLVHTEHGKPYTVRRRTRWLGRLAAPSFDRFFCVSRDIADEVLTHRIAALRKVFVVPNGIDVDRFARSGDGPALREQLGIPRDALVVGTVGRLREIKRQDLLIRAFARVERAGQNPTPHLLVVGDGPLLASLRDLAAALGVNGRVHFAGYQAEPERFLGVMDIFALTSRSEGMPLAILEAWAAELPVVASRVGGIPELVVHGDNGLLFDSEDENALYQALKSLVADPQRAQRMGAAGHRLVRLRYHVATMAGAYEGHYRELLESSGVPAHGVTI